MGIFKSLLIPLLDLAESVAHFLHLSLHNFATFLYLDKLLVTLLNEVLVLAKLSILLTLQHLQIADFYSKLVDALFEGRGLDNLAFNRDIEWR